MTTEALQQFCLSLPATSEEVKWEHNLCFMVDKKIFCLTDIVYEFGIAFKCSEEDFAELLERDGIIQAPHMARNKWIKVVRPDALTKDDWKEYIQKSYNLVAAGLSKKRRAELGL